MPGWPDRRLTGLFGTRHPIVQAPMAGATSTDMIIGAMAGGALGSLPCGMLTPDGVAAAVAAIRERSDAPLNLNFFCHRLPPAPDIAAWQAALASYYAEYGIADAGPPPPLRAPFDAAMGEAAVAAKPAVASFHYGLPDEALLAPLRAAGIAIVSSATTVAEARHLAARGCDAIIAMGYEAGGHRGWFLGEEPDSQIGTMALVPQVVDAVACPVIAAGGIADARGIAAALMLGAAGVQIGTAYLFTDEAPISAAHRRALNGPEAEATLLTNLFSGGVARGMRNRLVAELGPMADAAPPFPHASAALAPLRKANEALGGGDFSPLWAGQTAPLGRAGTARALTERLASEALARLDGSGSHPPQSR
jgi:nitronate monooxygenase